MMRKVEIYDTTLRDGAQQLGVNFSVADKIAVAKMLNTFGITSIEGGWPGAIPKDTEFFEKSPVPVIAFGATCKPETRPEDDEQLTALVNSQIENPGSAKTVTVVAKSDPRHVEKALKTTLDENLGMVKRSVEFLKSKGLRAIVDAEHFFDAVRFDELHNCADGVYAFKVVKTAFEFGAQTVVLCDTNGGMLPNDITRIVKSLLDFLKTAGLEISDSFENGALNLGIHAHNDTGCAVANSIAAFEAGVAHIQGTINEYGERTGNANLLTIVANLELKLGVKSVPNLAKSFNLAHNIAELANINLNTRQPYVGDIAFAHKAGLHASAIKVEEMLYQHTDPKLVGNEMSMIISEMAGKSSIELKSLQLGYQLDDEIISNLVKTVKEKEQLGYAFDCADASFELLLLDKLNKKPNFFEVESWRTISEKQAENVDAVSEATVKLLVKNERVISTGEGNGPVNALDAALRKALVGVFPQINDFELTDYRVRLLDTAHGTDSVTRVLITCYDSILNHSWTTIGVGGNIIESSWEALTACYIYGLNKRAN